MSRPDFFLLGLGNTVDYELVWNPDLLSKKAEEFAIEEGELTAQGPIENQRQLLVSILGFLKEGRGGECFVAHPSILEKFAASMEKKVTLGGTSVRAALAMAGLGVPSTLHLVATNPETLRLLPQSCRFFSSETTQALYPHVIVQYPKGSRITTSRFQLTAPRSNRLIYVNDPANQQLEISKKLAKELENAQVFLLSGLNAIHSGDLLSKRLEVLLPLLKEFAKRGRVMYEDACFHNRALAKQVQQALLPVIHIYSLNEDEWQAYLGRTINLLDPEDVMAGVRSLHQKLPVPVLVIHTRYWALAYGPKAGAYKACLMGGVAMATARFCYGDAFSQDEYNQIQSLPPEPQGAQLAAAMDPRQEQLICVPSLAAKEENPTTIGLGDAFVGGFLAALAEE